MTGLVKEKAQAVQKALMPTAVLGSALGLHGQRAEVLEVPIEYAELALSLAASINAFVPKQHLRRKDVAKPKPAMLAVETPAPVPFAGDELPW